MITTSGLRNFLLSAIAFGIVAGASAPMPVELQSNGDAEFPAHTAPAP